MAAHKAPKDLNHEPEAVTWARKKSGLTKQQVAEALGCAPSLITEIEQGKRNLTDPNLLKLAQILNCPVVVLERKRNYQPDTAGTASRDPETPAEPEPAAAAAL